MKVAGKVEFRIRPPSFDTETHDHTERQIVRNKHFERLGAATVAAVMRSSVNAFVSHAGFSCAHGAVVALVVPASWPTERFGEIGGELLRLIYAEYGARPEAELERMRANDLGDKLWIMKWLERTDGSAIVATN